MARRSSLLLAAAFVIALPALPQDAPTAWKPFQEFDFLMGSWTGTAEQAGRLGGKVVNFSSEIRGVVLIYRGNTIFPATEGKPEEETRETAVLTYDGDRRKYEATLCFNTGVWGQFDADVSVPGTVRLVSTRLVNYDAGARFRATFSRQADGSLSVLLELAPAGKDFAVFSAGKLGKK